MGEPRVIRDFLPSPDELVFREEDVKVTIVLSRRSVEFFKDAAVRAHAPYQRMIRRLLDLYVDAHAGRSGERDAPRRPKTGTR
jgi:hypothetical protein